ncbi:folylpolyglutamate synthase [Geosmithia morbida]|uniref:tetrahydrofolate synthase n=1 Tax=Geosmithia morbida TaxID=1094350 RepID=A0A9P4YZT5_9HYPO|nr:folylpolyglutamate synthase [Geosmithia morbida]KAF4125080.1 folylpolyglutamate synthase [Geosmithia morbida]
MRLAYGPWRLTQAALSVNSRRHHGRWVSTSTSAATASSYAAALDRLAALQSNRHITKLFDRTGSSSSSSSSSSKDSSGGGNKNAAAIPEMIDWLGRAGYSPQDLSRIRHIHVSGTKGKGSVCAYASSMLRRAGAGRVGTYTSPHLMSPRERIAIDGSPVSQEVFAAGVHELWDRFSAAASDRTITSHAEADGPATKPFYFRFLTILAWHIFLSQGVHDVVLECGIGGEYDATNVLPAEAVSAAVVTQLSIDHVGMLGGTVEEIAWHKTGIFKRGVAAVTRRVDERPSVMDVVRSRAAERGVSSLVEVDDAAVEAWGGFQGAFGGGFQKYNQALAVMAVREHLGMREQEGGGILRALRDIPDWMRDGLRSAKLRGRGEVLDDGPKLRWLLDGAHTEDSLYGVAASLAQAQAQDDDAPPMVLVFNQQERDASELLRGLIDAFARLTSRERFFSHAIFTTNDLDRSDGKARDITVQKGAADTMAKVSPGTTIMTCDSLPDAVDEVRKIAAEGDVRKTALVTGSMHLVGGVLRTLEPDSLL